MSGGYKELIVWNKSMDLAREIYAITNNFPREEQYGLISQMRRSAVSIPSNIAEGSKRNTQKDFKQFIAIALGSTAELETQVELSKTLPFGTKIDFSKADDLLVEVSKMLTKMITKD